MQYRIQDVQHTNRGVMFMAYELRGDAYYYIGIFFAPKNTKRENLENYIVE